MSEALVQMTTNVASLDLDVPSESVGLNNDSYKHGVGSLRISGPCKDGLILIALLTIAVIGNILTGSPTPEVWLALLAAFGCFWLERMVVGKAMSFVALTIPSAFVLAFLVVLVVPVAILYGTLNSDQKLSYFLTLLATLVVFPFGVWLSNFGTRPAGNVLGGNEYTRPEAHSSLGLETILWTLMATAIVQIAVYCAMSDDIQLLSLIQKSGESNRFASRKLPKVVQLLFEIARRVQLPWCMLFTYFMRHRHGGKWKILFPCFALLTLIVSSLTLDRSPVLAVFAMLGAAYLVSNNGSRRLNWLYLLSILVAGLVTGGAVTVFQYQQESASASEFINAAWYVATERVFRSPIEMALYAFEDYNYDTVFCHGQYIRALSFLPGINYAESMSNDAPRFAMAPVTFVGDLWRNWGWPGVIMGAMVIAYIFQVIQRIFGDNLSPARSSAFVLVMLGTLTMIHGKATGIMTLSVIFLGAMLGIFIRYFEERGHA